MDAVGSVRNWWTHHDRRSFWRRASKMARYYSSKRVGKEKVNGTRTLSENIADNGGLHIALQAMHEAGITSTIDGQTADQRFFLGFARVFARNIREQTLWFLLHNDTHAPHQIRINAGIPLIDEWYEAFDVRATDSLYVAPDKRVRIW